MAGRGEGEKTDVENVDRHRIGNGERRKTGNDDGERRTTRTGDVREGEGGAGDGFNIARGFLHGPNGPNRVGADGPRLRLGEKGPVAEAVAKGGRGQGEEERLEGCLEPAVPLIIGVIP